MVAISMLSAVIARERSLRPKQSPCCQRSLRESVLRDRSNLHVASGHCERAYFPTEAISTLPAVAATDRTFLPKQTPRCQWSLRGSADFERSNLHAANGHCEEAYFATEAVTMLRVVIAREPTFQPKQSPRCQRSLRGCVLSNRSNHYAASGHCEGAYLATEAISTLPAVIARERTLRPKRSPCCEWSLRDPL